MIREKKRNCWQKFLKENGPKDPWEIVRQAKNPWGSKSRMKTLKDLEGKVVEEEDRAETLEKAHCLWKEREGEEEEEDQQQQHVKDERLVYLDNHVLRHVDEN